MVARIRAQGGLVYAPHPFDLDRSSLGRVLPGLCARGDVDIIEVFNAKIADQALERPGRRPGLPRTPCPARPGRTPTTAPGVGAAYLDMPDFDGPGEFLAALGSARVTGEYRLHAPRYPAPGLAARQPSNQKGLKTSPAALALGT